MDIIQIYDINRILDLHVRIFGEKFIMDGYTKKTQKNKVYIYLFQINGVDIGYGLIVDRDEKEELYLWYVGILHEFQGNKFVNQFIEKAIELAKTFSYKSVTVATTNLRPNMIRLLVKNGFDIYDIKKRKEREGNKIYFKYKILPETEITLKTESEKFILVEFEKSLIRALKNNCVHVIIETGNTTAISYVVRYCNKFSKKPLITVKSENQFISELYPFLQKEYLGKIELKKN